MDGANGTMAIRTAWMYVHTWIRATRLHQWVKNSLVFSPPILAHIFLRPPILRASLLAFVAFGLCASSVYLTNDLFDLAADRVHPRKRLRPLAAGAISRRSSAWAAALLIIAAVSVASAINAGFMLALLFYYAVTWGYSLRLKRIVLLDVMILAALYTTRIVAGAAATTVPLSFWLLAFSVFIFLSLAFVKRYAELDTILRAEPPGATNRPYQSQDMPVILALGTASGYSAIVVVALYIYSPESQAIYRHQVALWLICPLMLFWISRIWIVAARGRMNDDPVVFAVRDAVSLMIFGSIVAIMLLAI
jgi:4-hydroxybenzoate polyprenyltransferase